MVWRETEDWCQEAEMKLSNRKEATCRATRGRKSRGEKWGRREETVSGKAACAVMSGLINKWKLPELSSPSFQYSLQCVYVNGLKMNPFFAVKSERKLHIEIEIALLSWCHHKDNTRPAHSHRTECYVLLWGNLFSYDTVKWIWEDCIVFSSHSLH